MVLHRMINIFKRYLKNPKKLIRTFGIYGLFNWMSDESYLKLLYWGEIGKKLNLKDPETFNEKLQWLKLNKRIPEYSIYVDKYAVRSFIADKLGEKYRIPHLGIYNRVEDDDWDSMPGKFVLKCTHASGTNIVCRDKSKLDIEAAKKKLKRWMEINWFWYSREWPYKNVKPRIICEEFISETDNTPDDYKVLCFNGKAKLIEVHIDIFNSHTQDFYDIKWNKTNISKVYPNSTILYDKPKQFDKMIELSELLANNIIHVRVDWFLFKNKLYFGEMTFFDCSGLEPFDNPDDDYLLGSWIDLHNNT